MSTPAEFDFVDSQGVWLGDSWFRDWTWQEGGVAVDLTGRTIEFIVETAAGVAELTLSTATSGVAVTDAAGGEFRVSITPTQSTALGIGQRCYRLRVTTGSDVRTLATGRFAVLGNV